MRFLSPITVRCSTLGRLAAFLLIVLIVSPSTAPFSAMPSELDASLSGPADSVKGETTHTVAIAEAAWMYVEPSWSVASFDVLTPTALVELARVNRILRL